MSTSNFMYNGRCIFISDADFRAGNIPETEKTEISGNRNYPTFELQEYVDKFLTVKIVLSSGYYSGACISYVYDDSKVEIVQDNLLSDYLYLIELCQSFDIQVDRRKIYELLKSYYSNNSYNNFDALMNYLHSCELTNINACLSGIKEEYQYTEIQKVATFSNGETIYQKIS